MFISYSEPIVSVLGATSGHYCCSSPDVSAPYFPFDRKVVIFLTYRTNVESVSNDRHRCYNPPDPPGYFEKVVWPMYLINKREMDTQTDIGEYSVLGM